MQHVKAYMSKIDNIIKNGAPKKPKGASQTEGVSDKNIRIIANYVKGIREAREEMVNAK